MPIGDADFFSGKVQMHKMSNVCQLSLAQKCQSLVYFCFSLLQIGDVEFCEHANLS